MMILFPEDYDVPSLNRRNSEAFWPPQLAHEDLVPNHHRFMALFFKVTN
jgi:hypothetical protein